MQVVKQMPTIAANQQPTIAIITALYCEKLAIDAMMENKKTYVKYKTEGRTVGHFNVIYIHIFQAILSVNVYTGGHVGECTV